MISQNKYKKINWLLVKNPNKKDLSTLYEDFVINQHDLKITLPPLQRPRLIDRDHYIMMILQFPYYNRETREIRSSEVDFFIGKDFLVTVTDGHLPPLQEMFDTLGDKPKQASKHRQDDMGHLLHDILENLLLYLFPILNHISQDLDFIENNILKQETVHRKSIYNILIIKRNIVNFRRIMQSHKDVIKRLTYHKGDLFSAHKIEKLFNTLIEHTVEIWASLENYRDTINALHETHESLVSYQINLVMKRLNVFAVIVFPLTLMAAVFGMNAINMPLVNHPHGFWIIVGFMFLGVILMWGYFRRKKWI